MDRALQLTLTLSLLCSAAVAQTPEREFGYAVFLLQQDDNYRAISQLKRISFDAAGTVYADRANLLIGKLYADQKEAQAALYHFTLVADGGEQSLRFSAKLFAWEQLCESPAQVRPCVEELSKAQDPNKTGLPRYLNLYYRVLLGEQLEAAVAEQAAPALYVYTQQLIAKSIERQNLEVKKPWLAGVLSAVIPGAGQLYTGRYLDALISFIVTGALIAGTVVFALPQNRSVGGAIALGSLGLGFYAGGIVNAVTDAFSINEKRYADFSEDLNKTLLPRMTVGLEGADLQTGYKIGAAPAVTLTSPAPDVVSPELLKP